MTVVFKKKYFEPEAVSELAKALDTCLPKEGEVVFICIGTNRNILDCLGPMAGTMIKDKVPELAVYGTLDEPIHALNMITALRSIRNRHRGAVEVAIDASLGKPEEVGVIQVRLGSLTPGKAVNKRLPAVGSVAVTGVVAAANDEEIGYVKTVSGSIAPVYYIARTISRSVFAVKEVLLARAAAEEGCEEG